MKPSKIMTKLKKTAVALSIVATGFLGASSPAHAYEGDPWFHEWVYTTYVAFVEEVDNQFFAINTYLAEIYAYMTKGEGETGKGVIGTMLKIWGEERPYLENMGNQGAAWNRRNTLDALPGQTILNRAPDPRNCTEIIRGAAGRGSMGGGGGTRAGKARVESLAAANSPGTRVSDTDHAADVLSVHGSASNGYCSKQDVSYTGDAAKAFGATRNASSCTAVGAMPDADARVQSIFVPAHDFEKVAAGDAAEIAKATSLTFNDDQQKAAAYASKNLASSFSPPAMSKEAEDSPAGKLLLAKQKILQARISPAVSAIAQIAAGRSPVALGTTAADGLAQSWLTNATPVYQRVFPAGTVVPQKPSSMEILRYEVYRRFLDIGGGADSWTTKLNENQDPAKIAQIQAETQAVQLYVEFELLNRIEENNAIQAAILAQLVNPITKQEVSAGASNVYRSK